MNTLIHILTTAKGQDDLCQANRYWPCFRSGISGWRDRRLYPWRVAAERRGGAGDFFFRCADVAGASERSAHKSADDTAARSQSALEPGLSVRCFL
jgi:hypothetical protein